VTGTAEHRGLQERRRPRGRRLEHGIPIGPGLTALCVIAAVAAGFADAHPVGVGWLDWFWSAAFAVSVVLAASRSRRMPTVWLAGVAGAVAVGGDAPAIVLGVASLAGAAAVALTRARERLLGALVGLIASQALLHGESYGVVGLPTLVVAAAVIPVLVSAWRIARSHERRVMGAIAGGLAMVSLVAGATAVVAASEARPHLRSASNGAEEALDLLRAGDMESAADEFSKAQYQFERASSSLDGPFGLLGRGVPVVAQQLEAIRRVSAAGEELGFAASQAAATADWRELTATEGTVDLTQVVSMQEPLARSSAALDDALATVADVRSPWLLAPLGDELDRLDDELLGAAEEARLAADGVTVAPALLGADGGRRYLIAFATPGESRNSGGFAGAYGVVEVDQGHLDLVRTGSTMRDLPLDPAQGPIELTDEWAARYGSYLVEQFPGNLSASPDWPTNAEVAAQLYERSEGGAPVDGVVYADPAALAAFLRLTGPVEVPELDQVVTADNVERYLLFDQYVRFGSRGANDERREALGEIAGAVLDALVSRPLPGLRRLVDELGPAVAEGHLRIAGLGDEAERRFFDDAGISGAWRTTEGADVIAVRSANRGQNKIDVFLHRSIDVDVRHDPAKSAVQSTVTVSLRNDAPSQGLPEYLIGNAFDLPLGTNRQLLTLYTPLDLVAATVDGMHAGVQNQSELGLHTYGVPIDIPAGATVTVVFEVAGVIPGADPYRLELLPQALANPDQLAVKVTPLDADAALERVLADPFTEPLRLAIDIA
jgi:hypothetical protein